MRICQSHWDQLKAAVESKGLSQFISSSGEEAVRRVSGQLEKQPETGTFDPLMNANFAIWSNALKLGGLYLMGQDEDGNPYCPMCESEKNGCYPASWWIDSAVNEQLTKAQALGLIPKQVQ